MGGPTIDPAVGDDATQAHDTLPIEHRLPGIYADAIATVQVTPAYIAENIVALAAIHNGISSGSTPSSATHLNSK